MFHHAQSTLRMTTDIQHLSQVKLMMDNIVKIPTFISMLNTTHVHRAQKPAPHSASMLNLQSPPSHSQSHHKTTIIKRQLHPSTKSLNNSNSNHNNNLTSKIAIRLPPRTTIIKHHNNNKIIISLHQIIIINLSPKTITIPHPSIFSLAIPLRTLMSLLDLTLFNINLIPTLFCYSHSYSITK
jgi:hypothetical protein